MNLAQLSALGIVTAAVVYLGAFLGHCVEWAAVRGLPASAGVESSPGATSAAKSLERSAADRAASARLRSDTFANLGYYLVIIGALAQTVGVITRGIAAHRAPWGNMYEFITASLLFVVVAYLSLTAKGRFRWLGLFISLLMAIGNGLAATVFYVKVGPLVPALHSVWFLIHIVAACIAGAAFNVGGLASIGYLLRSRAERVREATGVPIKGYLAKLPESQVIDTFAYRLHAFAFPVWTFTVAAGAIWAEYAWGSFWSWDPKETWALVTWVIYAGYLHARATAGWRGKPAAIIAIIGLASFWFNFVGINLFVNGMHSYAGI